MKSALAVAAVAVAVAGCGGSHQSDTTAIRAALAASPNPYLHYGTRTWGVQPRVRLRVRVAGNSATAMLSAPRAVAQRITLRKRGGAWRIIGRAWGHTRSASGAARNGC